MPASGRAAMRGLACGRGVWLLPRRRRAPQMPYRKAQPAAAPQRSPSCTSCWRLGAEGEAASVRNPHVSTWARGRDMQSANTAKSWFAMLPKARCGPPQGAGASPAKGALGLLPLQRPAHLLAALNHPAKEGIVGFGGFSEAQKAAGRCPCPRRAQRAVASSLHFLPLFACRATSPKIRALKSRVTELERGSTLSGQRRGRGCRWAGQGRDTRPLSLRIAPARPPPPPPN